MKKQLTNKFWILIFSCVFNLCCSVGAMAQPPVAANKQTDAVLVTGNPSLSRSDLNELIDFFEWLFEARFTDEQRAKFQASAIKGWKSSEKEVKGMMDIIENHRKFQALDAGEREKIRQRLVQQVAASFKNDPSEINALLSEIYQSGNKNSVAGNNKPSEPLNRSGAVSLADLAGTWSTSSVSSERYKNLRTGDLSDTSGNITEYIISPNGQIKHSGYLSNTIYACTTKLFFTKEGKISINGSLITFDYTSGERDYQNSCNSSLSGVKPIPPQKKTVPFTLERDEYGLKLCTLEDNNQFCIHKKS